MMVLVIDDDPRVREFLEEALDLLGHQSLQLASLAQARVEAAEKAPGVVFLDLRIPGEKGAENIVQARAWWPDAALVVVSGDIHPSLRPTMDAVGATALRKPFRIAGLRAALAAVAPDGPPPKRSSG